MYRSEQFVHYGLFLGVEFAHQQFPCSAHQQLCMFSASTVSVFSALEAVSSSQADNTLVEVAHELVSEFEVERPVAVERQFATGS